MSEPIFFQWVEIEAFRGFQNSQRLDLSSSVVLITGPNGTGKTSLFDALQWLLVGSIQRLEPWRVRRNAEHIVNQWRAASGEVATVAAGIRVSDEQVELRRTGRHDGSQLEWRGISEILLGDDAEKRLTEALVPAGRTSLRRSLLRSGLLQQDVIREVLEDKPAERYDQLAAILGLDAIGGFPGAARARATTLAAEGTRARNDLHALEVRLSSQREQIQKLRVAAAEVPSVADARSAISKRVGEFSNAVVLRGDLPVSPTEAESLRTEVARVGQALSTSLELHDRQWADLLSRPVPTADELAAATKRRTQATAAVNGAARALDEITERLSREREAAAQLTRLAVEALPLLSDQCPVCSQSIDAEHVRKHLTQLLEGDQGGRLARLEGDRTQASSYLSEAKRVETAAVETEDTLTRLSETITRAAAARARWLQDLTRELPEQSSPVELPSAAQILQGELGAIGTAVEGLRDLWRVLGELVAVLGSTTQSTQLSVQEAQTDHFETQVKSARDRATRASAAEEEAKTLQRAAVRAATAVTDRRFDRLKPIIQDIYSRLDPHPAFTDLLFAVDVYRERSIASPQVADPDSGVEADPLLIFSSAQANVVALSAFLALGWAAREDAMPFLLLDDPLQSLDDVNALGFADLCRHVRTRRQLIVSTHDKRLAALLERKLAPRRQGDQTSLLRFSAWSRSGPDIDSYTVPPQLEETVRSALLPQAA